MASKCCVFILITAAVALSLAGCSTGDNGALTGTWMGGVGEETFLSSCSVGDTVDVTIKINADKSWSWSTNGVNDSSLDSTGSGTYTLDTTAKTAQFTIATCSSSEVAAGTVAVANYSLNSSGTTVTFDFHGTTGATGGSIALSKLAAQ